MKKTQSGGSQEYIPKEYHKYGIRLCLTNGCMGLLLDPGLGKTGIILATLSLLLRKLLVRRCLVVAPLRAAYLVWPAEIKKWTNFNHLTCAILHGPGKLERLNQPADLYVINPEGLPWLFKQRGWRKFDMLVVDESTQFKNSTGKRFRLLRGALNSFRRRYILTGTPAPNGLIDLFGQIYILDQGHALGRFVTHYRQKWFVPAGYRNYDWQPVEGAEREIAKAIEPITVRMRAEDYINMPQLQNHFIMLDLPTGARRHYNELEQEFFTLLEEEPIVAPNTAVAGGKCRQILNGAIYTEKPEWKAVHDAKLEALGDLMSELSGQPLLVLYEFQHDRERIMKEYRGFRYIGGSNMQKQQHIVNGFNSGRVKYVIGHPKSMGHALNLQGKCAHVCWYGLTWNLEHYDQAIRRVWRSGNEAPRVIVHHLCIRNSLDQAVVQALGRKHKTQTTLTEAIRSLHSQFR